MPICRSVDRHTASSVLSLPLVTLGIIPHLRTRHRGIDPEGRLMTLHRLAAPLAVYLLLGITIAEAQMPSGPPAVGVVRAEKQAVTETSEFIGRVQAVDRV